MTDLETQIRKLSLRAPGEQLDRRVLAELHDATNRELTPSASLHDQDRTVESKQVRRGFLSIAFNGMAVALVIGFFVGNSVPSILLRSASTDFEMRQQSPLTTSVSSLQWPDAESMEDPEFSQGHPMLPGLPSSIVEALQNRGGQGSQFVESHYEFARGAAAMWERKNGELFNVATHVSDRRFDMCRDCHRVGG